MKTNKKDLKKLEAVKELKEILKGCVKDNHGYRLAMRIDRVARSNMSRCISVYAQTKKGFYRNITKLIATINEETYTADGCARIVGCGMDILFNTCYELNSAIKNLENYKGHKKDNYNYLVSTYYDLI